MDDIPIFTQLSMEMAPEWYFPVQTEPIFLNGKVRYYRLSDNPRDIFKMIKPPWL